MRITGFKLLKGGIGGIEVTGVELVDSGASKVMFKDDVTRIRRFPLSVPLRNAIAALNYPFLVGTEYWQKSYVKFMREDFSRPNRDDKFIGDPTFVELVSFWDACKMNKCTFEKGMYKMTGEFDFDISTVKAVVSIASGDDNSLYSFVEETLQSIVEMIDQALHLPQLALGTGEEIRGILHEFSQKEEDELPEAMSRDDAYMELMRRASKKGYGIVMDDNMLSLMAENVPGEDDDTELDKLMGTKGNAPKGIVEEFVQFNESAEDIVSMTTKDGSIFIQEPIQMEDPD